MENREIVMLGISIETKELCCRNSKDCLLYRIYLYVLDKINTAILSECSPFREGGLWITDCKRFNVKFIPFICVFACVEWVAPNSWKEIEMMHECLYRSIEKKKCFDHKQNCSRKVESIGVTIKCTRFGDVGIACCEMIACVEGVYFCIPVNIAEIRNKVSISIK